MKNFIVYDAEGKILRTGSCQDSTFQRQAEQDEFVMEGTANDVIHKIVGGKLVNKTPEEIEKDNPPPVEISESQRQARVTNEQWQSVLERLNKLETKIGE